MRSICAFHLNPGKFFLLRIASGICANSASHAARYGPPICSVVGGQRKMRKFEIATALNAVFVAILALGFLLSTDSFAQTAPASQSPTTPQSGQQSRPPAAQQPATGQEPAAEEEIGRRKKPKDYKNW